MPVSNHYGDHVQGKYFRTYPLVKMKKIAIVQSNYIPWKGYFDMIAAVDEFILFDEVQFTKRDWRNRNQIKTPLGAQWLSIPVGGCRNQKIHEVSIANNRWQPKHWRAIELNYRRAAYFDEIAAWLEPLYKIETYTHLSQINRIFIESICKYTGIKTVIRNSSDYTLISGKTERLANLCLQAGGTEYISGPAAMNYIEEVIFTEMNIKLTWFNYDDYPPYSQLWGEFIHGVTMLDLLFNTGKNARHYMRYVNT